MINETSTQEMEQKETPKVDLIYKIEDKPNVRDSFFAAFQHLLAIFVAIITPPLIIAGAIGCSAKTTAYLISMALFASGISTFIQCKKIGPIGAKLLCIQGTSFSFIGPIMAAAVSIPLAEGAEIPEAARLAMIFSVCMAASPVEMIISRFFKYLRNVITPLVSGIVVLLIGLSLIKVGVVACAGGYSAMHDGTFGSWQNLFVAASVIISVIIFNRINNKYFRMSSIVLGLIVGYIISYFFGMFDITKVNNSADFIVNIPIPFKYGFGFSWGAFISIAIIYVITAIEATGDVTANCSISGEKIEGPDYVKRVSGGVLADGFNSFLAGVFNSFPNSIFAQNNGLIQLTGVASRRVGYYIAGFLIVLSLFPIVGNFFSIMPEPVLGGATLLMFGTVAAAGIRIISSQEINRKATMVLAISLSLGLGVELMPDVLGKAPEFIKAIFSSGITTGGLTAIIANLVIRK